MAEINTNIQYCMQYCMHIKNNDLQYVVLQVVVMLFPLPLQDLNLRPSD